MDIKLSNGIEEVTINTSIIWWLDEKHKSFDDILTDTLLNMKKQGFHVVTTDMSNIDGWGYIAHNLKRGDEILA
jgi:hypothetical protein